MTKEIEKNEQIEKTKKNPVKEFFDFVIPILIAIAIALVLKYCVLANIVVPTGSMLNTIQEGDRIIASRLAYINSDPQRYDIVIFKYPDNENELFIKRVIGLPGETVEIVNGTVYVTQTDGKQIQLDDSFVTACEPAGDYGPYKVPENSYFMLGDNRNYSKDSRFWINKYVQKDKIIGKALFKYYPGVSKVE